jgi:hypothetical protein
MVWRLNNLNMIQRPWETWQPVAKPSPSHPGQVKLRGGGVPGAPMGPMAMPRAPDFDEPNSLLPSELLGPDQYAGPNSSLPWPDSHFPAASCFSGLDFDIF